MHYVPYRKTESNPEIVMLTSRRLLIVGSLVTLSVPAGARTSTGDDAIRALLATHTEQWNLHDIDAWAEILHDDADRVHWGGGYWRGKDQVEAGTQEIHRTYYRNSRMTPQRVEDLTFLSPDIALAHVRSELTGDERSPGVTFQYRKSALFTRKEGPWRIRALHNTRIRPNAIAADVQ